MKKTHKGVTLLSDFQSRSQDRHQFEQAYITVRDKEGRLLDDEQVLGLPVVEQSNPHFKEWQIREHSAKQVLKYLNQQTFEADEWVLDIGCGNGWFSDLMAKALNDDKGCVNVLAIDINMTELEQAARVFQRDNLSFAYLDLMQTPVNDSTKNAVEQQFKLIFLNSCFQYFPDTQRVIEKCLALLVDGGEIHILDSPFYPQDEVLAAKTRSQNYYQQLEASQMMPFYHHHSQSLFDAYFEDNKVEYLYKPLPKAERIGPASPFPWIKICK